MQEMMNAKRVNNSQERLNIFFGGLDGLSKRNKAKAKVIVLAIMSKYYDKIASLSNN